MSVFSAVERRVEPSKRLSFASRAIKFAISIPSSLNAGGVWRYGVISEEDLRLWYVSALFSRHLCAPGVSKSAFKVCRI